jgi:hypothetical protein|tara:strand:+ start:107 stop:439 length:333 start_codon:yes stop_codon:yes gene_type:complete
MSETIDEYIRLGEACQEKGEKFEERGEAHLAKGEYLKAVEYYDKAMHIHVSDQLIARLHDEAIEGYIKARTSFYRSVPGSADKYVSGGPPISDFDSWTKDRDLFLKDGAG